jgi:hypothetical protein
VANTTAGSWANTFKWFFICATGLLAFGGGCVVYVMLHFHLIEQKPIETMVHSSVQELQRQSKLVVLSGSITVYVSEHDPPAAFFGVPLGDGADVLVVAPENHFQYVVSLKDLSPADFAVDLFGNKVTVTVPAPVLDEEIVEVQSNPRKIVGMSSLGLLRFSADNVRELAQRRLRPKVLEQARTKWIEEEARRVAELSLRSLLSPLVKRGLDLEVRFRPAP